MTSMNKTSSVLIAASVLPLTLASALAHDGAPIPDGHAPAGVMVDHMHKAGELMIGYRYGWSRQGGDYLLGTDAAGENRILHRACDNPPVPGHEHCSMKQSRMTMQMHMLDIMYAPTDWLTLMVMPQWMKMDMTMVPVDDPAAMHSGHGMHMGAHGHGTDGLGDTTFGALVRLSKGASYSFHTGLMFSAPTGSTSEKTSAGQLTHYMMQLGSGTWDFLPSLTYTGNAGRWGWGLQASGVVRLEDENDQGYRLGDVFQTTAWGSYRVADWLSASVRLLRTQQSRIEGSRTHTGSGASPADLPFNYGGNFWDIGFGINTVVPSGALQGHRLGVEWLQPIRDEVNGYQPKRDGSLMVNWSKAF